MYQYLFDDDVTDKVKSSTNKSKSVLEQFDDVDKKYALGNKVDTKLTLKRMDYSEPTQEEVLKKAKNSLSDYKNKGIDKINSNYQLKNEQIDNSIKNVQNGQAQSEQKLINLYQDVKQNAENDAIKRGLARSSIIVNKLENYDNKMLNELAVLTSESNNQINQLTTQKNTLELEKDNALKSFDIEYAVKLQDKINSINDDITKTKESVIKYNNQIAELEAKWEKEAEKENYSRQKDLQSFIANNGTYALESLKRDEKYYIAKEHFAGLDKQEALSELKNNSVYKESLGEYNYDKLLKELEQG